ncbi:MAG: hypothetical protein P4L87_03415 [Formivibrio sp.]|nr:hypothetical protein [Formivibrio sp.]
MSMTQNQFVYKGSTVVNAKLGNRNELRGGLLVHKDQKAVASGKAPTQRAYTRGMRSLITYILIIALTVPISEDHTLEDKYDPNEAVATLASSNPKWGGNGT